jgi:hypothetical protein
LVQQPLNPVAVPDFLSKVNLSRHKVYLEERNENEEIRQKADFKQRDGCRFERQRDEGCLRRISNQI